MLKTPTHRNKTCSEKARWLLLCRLARTWGKGWNKTERSMWESIGPPIKLQMRLLQFYKKNEQTHGKGRVNRSVWLVGRGGPRQWVVGLAANELGVKIVRWIVIKINRTSGLPCVNLQLKRGEGNIIGIGKVLCGNEKAGNWVGQI